MKKQVMSLCLVLAILVSMVGVLHITQPEKLEGKTDAPMVATPTTTNITVMHGNNPSMPDLPVGPYTTYRMLNDIPAYLIQQYNGWSSNYVKLRDIAYALDFCVMWDSTKPNEMRIYTNKRYNHYADQQPYVAEGPATEVRTATNSTMDLYVDDKLVEGVQPVMIGWNNYFKIRDLAKAVNFGCSFFPTGYQLPTLNNFPDAKLQSSIVGISYEFPYQDNDPEFMDANDYTKLATRYTFSSNPAKLKALQEHQTSSVYYAAGSRRNIEYETPETQKPVEDKLVRPTYGYPSGELMDKPVTITEDMPWARENYFDRYASKELKALLGYDASSDSKEQVQLERTAVATFNAVVQMLVDQDKVGSLRRAMSGENTDWTQVFIGNKVIASAHPNYAYPQAEAYSLSNGLRVHSVDRGAYAVEAFGNSPGAWTAVGGKVQDKLDSLGSDRERVQYLAELVCRKMEYAGSGKPWVEMQSKLNNVGIDVYDAGTDGKGTIAAYDKFYADIKADGLDVMLNESKQLLGACSGYAAAFDVVARNAGFYSFGVAGEGHAWNEVWLPDEGKWVGVDCTWADTYYRMLSGDDEKASREDKSFVGGEIIPVISAVYDGDWNLISSEKELVCYKLGSDKDPHTTYLKEEAAQDKATKFTEEILETAYKLNPQRYVIDTSVTGNVELVSK